MGLFERPGIKSGLTAGEKKTLTEHLEEQQQLAAPPESESDSNSGVRAAVADVSPVDDEPAAQIESLDKHLSKIAARVRAAKKKAAAAILAIGKELSEAQRLLATPGSGSFVKFVRQQCGLSTSSAYRAIDAYNRFGDEPGIAKSIEPAALHVLAKAPEAAVEEIRVLMSAGETITSQVAAKIVRDHKPKKAKDDKPAPIIIETQGGRVVVHPLHDHASIEQILSAALQSLQQARKAA